MFRRNKDAKPSAAALGAWFGYDNLEPQNSHRHLRYFLIAFIALVLCVQIFSTSVILNSSGIRVSFSQDRNSWAIAVIACNRPWYLEPVLKKLLDLPKHQLSGISLFVSQDGYDKEVEKLVKSFQNNLTHWQRPRPRDDQSASTVNLAKHYKWTLDKLFFEEGFSHVIILEEDLLVSNDFLSYFKHTSEILDLDGRVMCISAHNDVGRKDVAIDPSRLFRTSFFPGLGWMLKKSFWQELSPMWPTDHFDWWLRSSAASRGRVCIAPEVNRIRHIGHIGVNCNKDRQGESHYDVNLSLSALPSDSFYEDTEAVDYTSVQYLLRPAYDRRLSDMVSRADVISPNESDTIARLINGTFKISNINQIFLVIFRDRTEYEMLQKVLFLHDFSEQRSFYKGILEVSLPDNAKLLVANARTCVFLPPEYRTSPLFGIVPIVSDEGTSCDEACNAKHLQCVPQRFEDVSDAYLMESFFPCERNAWVLESSNSNPRYHRWPLNSDDDPLSSGVAEGTCFANSRNSECSASLPGAFRLCPCSHSGSLNFSIMQDKNKS